MTSRRALFANFQQLCPLPDTHHSAATILCRLHLPLPASPCHHALPPRGRRVRSPFSCRARSPSSEDWERVKARAAAGAASSDDAASPGSEEQQQTEVRAMSTGRVQGQSGNEARRIEIERWGLSVWLPASRHKHIPYKQPFIHKHIHKPVHSIESTEV